MSHPISDCDKGRINIDKLVAVLIGTNILIWHGFENFLFFHIIYISKHRL